MVRLLSVQPHVVSILTSSQEPIVHCLLYIYPKLCLQVGSASWLRTYLTNQYVILRYCSPNLCNREGNGTPLQYSCLANPTDRGAWGATVHGVTKSRTQLSNFPFTFHFHALEKEMATHSSVLAWRIPGTGKPVGCRPLGRTESDTTEAT